MRAVRLYAPGDMRFEEAPRPEPGPGEVLIRVRAAGLCRSDIHFYLGHLGPLAKSPVIMGHEGAGVVEEVGPGVEDLSEGDKVCVHYVLSCWECEYCLTGRDNICERIRCLGFEEDGTFAEYVRIPARNAVKVEGPVPFDQLAITGCAVVTPFHAARMAGLKPGESVAVFGIGGVGIHALQVAKLFGASRLIAIDIADYKLRVAEEVGADLAVNAVSEDPIEAIRRGTGGRGVDVCFVCVGARKAVEQALRCVKTGGRVILVGYCTQPIQVDAMDFLSRELQLRTSIEHTLSDLRTVVGLVEKGLLDPSLAITHRLPLGRVEEAFSMMEEGKGEPIKIVLMP